MVDLQRRCQICLEDNINNGIKESTCYIKYFTQITGVTLTSGTLWLCVWCNRSLMRTIALIKLSIKSEKLLNSHNEALVNKTELNKLYNFLYIPLHHIDIPPSKYAQEELHADNLNPEDLNSEDTDAKALTVIDPSDNKPKVNKRKNYNYKELGYEIKYLTTDEQLDEIKLKKERNKLSSFVCEFCGVGFYTSELFQEHKARHSKTSQNKCSICHLTFKTSEALSQHALSHRRKFRCLLCDVVFNRWSHCLTHRYRCGSGSTPIACKYCSKIYRNEYSLNLHVKVVHMKEKKHICEICQSKFSSKQRLTVHMRSHTGNRPFACDQCSRTFTTNSNLRAHSAVHDDVSRFYCVECNTYYKSEKSLKRHFRTSARHTNDATNSPTVLV